MITTPYDYLMNICTACYLVCYIPDLYANYRNKNANFLNIPEKVLIFIGTGFALAFSVLNNDSALILNFSPLFILDGASLAMRSYYAIRNRTGPRAYITQTDEVNIVSSNQEGDGPARETTGTHTL
jgi:hypothetical protein